MSDEKLELTEEEKLKLAEEEKLRLEEEKKKEEERLAKEKKEKEDKIQELIDSVDFEEEETHKRWDREAEAEVEYKVKLVHQFFHWEQFPFCDCIEIKDEEDKVIEVKHLPWNKKTIIKFLKESLDVEKAQAFVDSVASYKHNKKKSELESKLRLLVQNNVYFLEAFGEEVVEIKGEIFGLSVGDRIAKWDKDDLIDFEAKVLKLEEAKVKLDEKDKKEKPIKDRELEYKKIDGLLLEALVEKHEEGRPEKMVEYLKLRKEIKDKHPLED